MNKIFLAAIGLVFMNGTYAQKARDNKSHIIEVSFGGMTKGEISIADHLNDSLEITDPQINEWFSVRDFHVTLMCKGQVLKSIEAKGNRLTDEMKAEIKKLHPGCSLLFGARLISVRDAFSNQRQEIDYNNLRLVLK